MRFPALSFLFAFALLTPSLAHSQGQQYTNCHTPESAGNFVGTDEVIVNDMICKTVKTQPGAQQTTVAKSKASAQTSQNQPTSSAGNTLTNARIIEMSKLGLDDDILIAKIKNSNCQFQLGDKDLVDLKKAGVSSKVIAAMLDAGATPAKVPSRDSEALPRAPAESTPNTLSSDVPSEPGMYVTTADGPKKILGQIVDTKRTGSLLVSGLTMGIKTNKQNVQILGAHAETSIGPNPEFHFVPAKQEAEAGVNAGDLILIRLEEKHDRRQFEVAAKGAWRASSGVALSHEVQLYRSEVRPGVYKIQPAVGLQKGEYALYLSRGEGMAPYIYDFSVR